MLDALRSVFARIHRNIMPEMLELCFEPWNHQEKTLDQIIYEDVILASVRDDASRQGGKLINITLQMNWCKYTHSPSPVALGISGSYSTFLIPPEAREFRDIVCAVSVRMPYNISTNTTGTFFNDRVTAGNTVGSMACAALKAQTLAGTAVFPTADVQPGNIITLTPPSMNWVPWMVKVRLKFDDNFSGMNSSSLETFQKACEYAIKAYMYSHLRAKVESNVVLRGADIGVIREELQTYADAAEKYDEAIRNFHGAEILGKTRLGYILTKMVPFAH